MGKIFVLLIGVFSSIALAQVCPSGDDPAISQKVSEKVTVILCGFEDHEFPVETGQRAFSDFKVFSVTGGKSNAIYSSAEGETHLIQPNVTGLALTEIWQVGDKSVSALTRDLTCEGEVCKLRDPKCMAKIPKNPYPTALSELQALMKKGKLKPEAEDLIDKVFAQALGGDKPANQFFTASQVPKGFDGANAEAWEEAHKRIELARKSKCL